MSGDAIHIAAAILALAATLQPELPGSREAPVDASHQLARSTQRHRSSWSDDSDDKGAELDRPLKSPKGARLGGGSKTGAGGSRRFWSHYHSARPEPKGKPVEKQPREAK